MDEIKPKTAEVWRERMVAWQASGQSVRAWCMGMGTQNGFFRTFDETECPVIALARSIS
jgi:hypothetical protein